LHGGSGTPPHYFIEAVKIGITKININSDMRVVYRQTLEKVLSENKTEYAVIKLMDTVITAVQSVVESKIDMFNSSGKARVS
jgi:fructose-bisphosphate aldolase class II